MSRTSKSSTSFLPSHTESYSHHQDWARLCWCLLCTERPEGDPNLFQGTKRQRGALPVPGHPGGSAAPKTAEALTVLANVWLCICPAGLKAFAFATPQECCKD